MMNKTFTPFLTICLALLLFSLAGQAQNPNLLIKATSATSADQSGGYSTAVDASGNIYVTGTFIGTVTFGTTTLVCPPLGYNSSDIFLAKYNSAGVLQWAKRAGSSGVNAAGRNSAGASSIAVSGNDVYITGVFQHIADFNSPSAPGSNEITSAGDSDIFLAKYNSDGTFQWARRAGGTGYDYAYDIAVSGGDIYITGAVQGTANFNTPSATGSNQIIGTENQQNFFLAKYNSEGDFQWARRSVNIANSGSFGFSVAVSGSEVYITGYYSGPITFNTPSVPGSNETTLPSLSGANLYLAQYNSDGTFQWAKRAGGRGLDNNANGTGVVVSGSDVYITGGFDGTINFNTPFATGSNEITSAGYKDIFLAKYNRDGTFQWAKRAGGTANDYASNIEVSNNDVYITGSFQNTANFNNPSATGNNEITSIGIENIFLAKYNITGGFEWASRAGALDINSYTTNQRGFSVAATESEVYLTGVFKGNANFNTPSATGSNELTTVSTTGEMFLARYNSSSAPTITASGTLTAFSTCAGTASASAQQSFTVRGNNLTANISVTASTGFEVSTTSNSGFGASVNLPQSGGEVANTTIFVRMTAAAAGTLSGNITCTSTGAVSRNVAANGTAYTTPSISLGSINSVLPVSTNFNIPYTATSGSPNQYSITTGTPTSMPNFSVVNNATLSSESISVLIPASVVGTYNFKLKVRNPGCGESSEVPFELIISEAAVSSITTSGTLTNFSSCVGTASTQQSFTVSGNNLTDNIIITAPTGFEVSTTGSNGFGSSITLIPSGASVLNTRIYVKMAANATGTPSGNITLASTGAADKTVAASGTINALPTITLGSINNVNTSATSFNIPYSASTDSPNLYSISTGTPSAMTNFSGVSNVTLPTSPIAVTIPASTVNTYNFNLTVRNSTTGCVSSAIPVALTVIPIGTPTITTSATSLSAFSSTCSGSASSEKSFTVSGSNLTTNITVTAPTGFEVSSTSGSGFGSSVTLTQNSGSVSSKTMYVRIAPTATGSISGNVTCASSGATTKNVAVSGTVSTNPTPTITLGTINSVLSTATSFSIPYTATTGSPNQYSISTGTPTAMASFSAVSNATLSTSPILVAIPAASAANTYNFNLTVRRSTTGCVSNVVPFTVTVLPPPPSITTTGTLSAFISCQGTASSQQSFTVSGANLTADITITPPMGFEVSTTGGSGFSSSVILPRGSGSVANTTVYVRTTATATGTPGGNIACTSTNAPTRNVTTSGTVYTIPTITPGSISSVSSLATNFTIPYSGITGSPNQYSISTSTPIIMPSFVAVSNATLNTNPISVSIPASAVGTYNFNLTVRNTGCESSVTPLELTVRTPTAVAINLRGNDNSIAHNSIIPSTNNYTDFGAVDVSSGTQTQAFKIENTGELPLGLTGTPIVNITGPNAADFTVTTQPALAAVPGLSSTNFVIRFDPSATGIRTATVTIANDDATKPLYTFTIQGTGNIRTQVSPHLLKVVNSKGLGSDYIYSYAEVNNTLFFSLSGSNELWKSDGTEAGTLRIGTHTTTDKFVNMNGTLYFTKSNELWKSDGTVAGTVMVKNIGNHINHIAVVNGSLYISVHTGQLWKSDGTAAGTVRIRSGFYDNLYINEWAVFNGTVYFLISNYGTELWKTDGTEAGTVQVIKINSEDYQNPSGWLRVMNGSLIISAGGSYFDQLWKSNGTYAGTTYLGIGGGYDPQIINNTIYYSTGSFPQGELWKSDGTEAGTSIVKVIPSGSSFRSSIPLYLTQLNGMVYFIAYDVTGNRLWKSDGTEAGTVKMSTTITADYLTKVGNTLYFAGDDGVHGSELWKSDGTTAGTTMVKDIHNGPEGSTSYNLMNINGTLFFRADDGVFGFELWKSDGTTAGTVLVKDIVEGIQANSMVDIMTVNNALFFQNNVLFNNAYASELWKTDGTEAEPVFVKTLINGSNSLGSIDMTNANGTLYFWGKDAQSGGELWKSDGTTAGTGIVKDIYPGTESSFSGYSIVNMNGTVFFSAKTAAHGAELWKSDGTEASTAMVKDIVNGPNGSNASVRISFNGNVFFTVYTGSNIQLWKSNGTEVGTVMVKSFPTATYNLSVFTNANGTLFFIADDGVNGLELWKTDGTEAGTVMVKDIRSGSASSFDVNVYDGFANINGTLFFRANDGINGEALWKSDGTAAGTVMVKDIRSDLTSPFGGRTFTNVNGTLFFRADNGVNGFELWKSDGTEAGTVMVKDIVIGSGSPSLSNFTSVNGIFYFTVTNNDNSELWRSDGTEAGTVLEKSLPGADYFYPQISDLTNLNGALYFETTTAFDNFRYVNSLWTVGTCTPINQVVTKPAHQFQNRSKSYNSMQQSSPTTQSCHCDIYNKLVATINAIGASPISGTINSKVWIDTAATANYVKRHYEITPESNSSTATGRITLYFTQQEFNEFNGRSPVPTLLLPTGPSDGTGKANLKIEKRSGTSIDDRGFPASYSGTATIIDPVDSDIVWNATLGRWEVSFDVVGFGGFFAVTSPIVIGASIISFSPAAVCVGGTVVITGTNLTGATAVSIGGTAVSGFAVNSPTQITATVGTGTTGTISVTTPSGVATSSGTLTVKPTPTIPIVSGSTEICQELGTTLLASSTIYPPFYPVGTPTFTISYQWTGGLTGSSIVASPLTTRTYRVAAVYDGCNSDSSAVFTLTVHPKPAIPTITANNMSMCKGGNVILTGTCAVTTDQFRWTTPPFNTNSVASLPYISNRPITEPGTYKGLCESNKGCLSAEVSITITQAANCGGQSFITVLPEKPAICPGASLTLTASGCSGTVTWTGGPTPQNGASVSVSPAATTTYTVNCSTGGSTTVTVIVATPNITIAADVETGKEKVKAIQTIVSDKKVGVPTFTPGANVIYEAGSSITLLPGFTAEKWSIFKAEIKGCP